MLAEYFSFNITPTGLIESLPLLLRDYTPNLDKLPSLLMRLGPQVLSYPQIQKRESNSPPS
jgi:DNA mismatch repair protein MLH1